MHGVLIGERGRYQILRELGRSDISTTYLARDPDLGRLVALKSYDMTLPDDREWARSLLPEARLASVVTHPNIVMIYEAFEANGTLCFAMQYLARGSIRPYVGTLTLVQIAHVLDTCSTSSALSDDGGSCTATSNRRTCSSPSTARSRSRALS